MDFPILIIICVTIMPSTSSPTPRPHGGRGCTNTEQKGGPTPQRAYNLRGSESRLALACLQCSGRAEF